MMCLGMFHFGSNFWGTLWASWTSRQDGGVGINASLSHTTERRITTNLKTKNTQDYQKIKLHGTPTTKELKKHSSRLVGGAQLAARQRGGAAGQKTTWARWGLAYWGTKDTKPLAVKSCGGFIHF